MKTTIKYLALSVLLCVTISNCKKDNPTNPTSPGTASLIWKKKLPVNAGKIMDAYGDKLILQRVLALNKTTGDLQWTVNTNYSLASSHRICGDQLLYQEYGLHSGSGGLVDAETGNVIWTYNFGNPQTSLKFPVTCPTADGFIYYTSDYEFSKFNMSTNQATVIMDGQGGQPFSFTNNAGKTKIVFPLRNATGDNHGVFLWDVNTQDTVWQYDDIGYNEYIGSGYYQGKIYVSSIDTLYKIDESSGLLEWKAKLNDSGYQPANMKFNGDNLYYQKTKFQSFDLATGTRKWISIKSIGDFQVFNDWILAIQVVKTPSKDYLSAFYPSTGAESDWKIQADSSAEVTSFYADSPENRVYITDSNEYIYCFEVQ